LKNNCFIESAINSTKSSICWMSFEVSKTWLYNSMNIDFLSELESMKVKVLQRIKNKHKNYFSMLSLNFQTRIWVYENQDTEFMRNFTVNSQKHQVYKNFYHQFLKALSLQEFKLHTNFNVSSTIKIQVTYNLRKILHELHVILLISLMMLKLSSLSI